jgi:hypothetical protein
MKTDVAFLTLVFLAVKTLALSSFVGEFCSHTCNTFWHVFFLNKIILQCINRGFGKHCSATVFLSFTLVFTVSAKWQVHLNFFSSFVFAANQ